MMNNISHVKRLLDNAERCNIVSERICMQQEIELRENKVKIAVLELKLRHDKNTAELKLSKAILKRTLRYKLSNWWSNF